MRDIYLMLDHLASALRVTREKMENDDDWWEIEEALWGAYYYHQKNDKNKRDKLVTYAEQLLRAATENDDNIPEPQMVCMCIVAAMLFLFPIATGEENGKK